MLSLPALENRVHLTDPALLPPQAPIAYQMPDDISRWTIAIDDLPPDWTSCETHTQAFGDQWLDSKAEVLLFVPAAIALIANIPNRSVLINRRAAETAAISIAHVTIPLRSPTVRAVVGVFST